MPRDRSRHLARLLVVAASAMLACSPDQTIEPPAAGEVTLLVTANLQATVVASVVVEVSAADLNPPRVFNLVISDGTASGTVTLPAGSDRTITLRAYDAGGVQTHGGSTVVDVQPGVTAAIAITLAPLTGDVTIDVFLGSVEVTVAPGGDTLTVGDTVEMVATVTSGGNVISSGSVLWATTNPGIATVTNPGSRTVDVAGVGAGSTGIVATYSGTAGAATVVVSGVPGLEVVTSALTNVAYVASPPGDATRLMVVSLHGVISLVKNGTVESTPFLDIQALVGTRSGEDGLLSMAFHPQYTTNGYFYVFVVSQTGTSGNLVIMRFTRSAGNPDVANAGSAFVVLNVPHGPTTNHNGGLLKFGPDGMLYIGTGDGGEPGDAPNNAQNLNVLLGKMLRIDVDGASPYAVPAANPFVSDGDPNTRGEIWAYGFRNPWRWSFDRLTGHLFLADVGEGDWEEVNFQSASSVGGENYGWRVMEGAHCFNPATGCDETGKVLPIREYSHDSGEPTGCSVTGGYVYRGAQVADMVGRYFYGDWCGGWVRSFRYENGTVNDDREHAGLAVGFGFTSFGEDANGELYLVKTDVNDGASTVYRMVQAP